MNKRSHIHKKAESSASNPVRNQLQSRPLIAQAQPQSQKPLSQTETENQEFQQQKFEATKLEIQAKYGTITPEGQEQLTVLQGKMSSSLQRRLEHASSKSSNFANIPISRPHAPSQPVVQTKLKIGEPGDKFEKDADQFAKELDQLTHAPVSRQIEQNLQPKEMSVAEKEIQTKPMLQLRAAVGGMTATAGLETAINQARGSGQPLADNVRKPMEQFSGTDLSRVRVHTDQKADQLSRSIQARAFTTGQDIFFAKGEYNTSTREGKKLIFHEGRHVE
ncbi:eCIS core domain-containing protein, partial [Nostoc sp.]